MLDDQDKEWVKAWVREYTEPRFVEKSYCEEKTGVIEGKLSNDFADMKVIKSQLAMIMAILGAVGLGVLGLVINQFWGV